MKISSTSGSVETNPEEASSRQSFTPIILRFASLPSTNTEAAAQARRGVPEGLTIVAAEQIAGRGRRERIWSSPAGAGLYASVVLRPHFSPTRLPLLTLAAALAICRALERTVDLAADIKWSNDILVRERKLCGILAEVIETPHGTAIILGFGINLLRTSLPPDVASRATSVEEETGRKLDADVLLRHVLSDLKDRYTGLHAPTGDAALLADYERASSYARGKSVRVDTGAKVFTGTTRGLAPDGALRVELPDGEIRVIHAGDVAAVRAVVVDAARIEDEKDRT